MPRNRGVTLHGSSDAQDDLQEKFITYLKKIKEKLQIIYEHSSKYFENEQDTFISMLEDIELFINDKSSLDPEHCYDHCNHTLRSLEFLCQNCLCEPTRGSPKKEIDRIINELKIYLTQFMPPVPPTPEMLERENQCLNVQNFVNISFNYYTEKFNQIKKLALKKKLSSKRIFISYAWPVENLPNEQLWIRDFVDHLAKHLKATGLIVFFDKHDSGAATELRGFMRKNVQEADHIIVICNRSTEYKFENMPACSFRFEYIEILKRIKNQGNKKNDRLVIPLCLTKNTPPPGNIADYAEVSVYTDGYLASLRELIERIYGFENDTLIDLLPEISESNINNSVLENRIITANKKEMLAETKLLGDIETQLLSNMIALQNQIELLQKSTELSEEKFSRKKFEIQLKLCQENRAITGELRINLLRVCIVYMHKISLLNDRNKRIREILLLIPKITLAEKDPQVVRTPPNQLQSWCLFFLIASIDITWHFFTFIKKQFFPDNLNKEINRIIVAINTSTSIDRQLKSKWLKTLSDITDSVSIEQRNITRDTPEKYFEEIIGQELTNLDALVSLKQRLTFMKIRIEFDSYKKPKITLPLSTKEITASRLLIAHAGKKEREDEILPHKNHSSFFITPTPSIEIESSDEEIPETKYHSDKSSETYQEEEEISEEDNYQGMEYT